MSGDFVSLLADLKEKEVLGLTREKLDDGENALGILDDSRKAMEIVGKRFAGGEYFLPELIYSAEILKQIAEMVKPKLSGATETERLGKVVLGTVAGDIHDIGLNIVEFMLDVNGFDVHNLGVDIPPERFVATLKETGATILALSGFLTLAFDAMRETVMAVEAAGLRDSTRIMIGGGQVDDRIRQYAAADACGKDAMAAVSLANEWVRGA